MSRYVDLDDPCHCFCGNDGDYEKWNIDPDAIFVDYNELYSDEEILKMQDLEQAQIQKAFELGREDMKAELID